MKDRKSQFQGCFNLLRAGSPFQKKISLLLLRGQWKLLDYRFSFPVLDERKERLLTSALQKPSPVQPALQGFRRRVCKI
jgi:hypothetical protein